MNIVLKWKLTLVLCIIHSQVESIVRPRSIHFTRSLRLIADARSDDSRFVFHNLGPILGYPYPSATGLDSAELSPLNSGTRCMASLKKTGCRVAASYCCCATASADACRPCRTGMVGWSACTGGGGTLKGCVMVLCDDGFCVYVLLLFSPAMMRYEINVDSRRFLRVE
jgi:hypothetical protein